MKAGFFGRKAGNQILTHQHTTSTPERVEAAASAPSAQPAANLPASSDTPQQQEASWQQCLQLLRSDVDEKKFVGLLLVTKLLPQGNDKAVQEVFDAVGLTFIQRLLLPLQHSTQQQLLSTDGAKLQQQQLSVVLGLSILSVVCRLEQASSSDEVLQLLPLLLKVAAAGGVGAVSQQQQTGPNSAQVEQAAAGEPADQAAEAAAAADALECVLACVASGGYQTSLALDSNALPLTVAALQTAIATLSCVSSTSSQQPTDAATASAAEASAAAAAASRMRCIMLAVQLLGRLLKQPSTTAALASQHPEAAAAAVMLLAHLFGGLPAGVNSSGTSNAGQASSGVDPAVLQLEAQHTLLLLLPLPIGSQSAASLQQMAATDPGKQTGACKQTQRTQLDHNLLDAAAAVAANWPATLRHGLCQLLRSRTGVVQRHSALRLAAAVVDLLGDEWLLTEQQHQRIQEEDRTAPSTEQPQQFLLILMEMLGIETPLLLSDAMNPGALVPRADIGMAARPEPTTAVSNQQQQQQQQQDVQPEAVTTASEMAVDCDEGGPDAGDNDKQQQQQPLTVQQILQQVQQQEAQASRSGRQQQQQAGNSSSGVAGPPGFQALTPQQQQDSKSLQQRLKELKLPADKTPGPEQQAAGARADQVLPACFLLLESCCEVLATQADLMEQLANVDNHTAHQQAGTDGADGGVVPPVLGLKEVEQLVMRMQQVTQVLLEFLEFTTSSAGSATVNPLLTAGAVRVLGRFLADAPDVHQEAVQNLLPRLLTVAVPGEPMACGVTFLLPALLLWTSSDSTQQQWVAVLLGQDGVCLRALAEYASHLAASAVATAERLDSSSNSSSSSSSKLEELISLEARLGTACQVLQQLLASLPSALAQQQHTQHHQQQSQSMEAVHMSDVHLQVLAPVLNNLGKWESMRRQQQRQHLSKSTTATALASAEAAAVAFLHSLQQVQLKLPVLLSVAAFCGQLLTLLAAHTAGATADGAAGAAVQSAGGPEAAEAAGRVLCWGCEAGWSYCLLQASQESVQSSGEAHMQQKDPCSGTVTGILADMGSSWVDAEFGDLWEVCLSATAELLLAGFPADLPGTCRAAPWAAAVVQSSKGKASQTAVAVVGASLGLQLLVPALCGRGL